MARRLKYETEFIVNSRGVQQFTCKWLPVDQEIKALVFLCHGYAMECSIFMKGTGERLAEAGYAVFGIDYEGHGYSKGLQGLISSFKDVVSDCAAYFKSVREKEEYRTKARFLLGESMGGAVSLRIHRKEPTEWNGAVLLAPMCKISEKLKPPKLVIDILAKLAPMFPTWKAVPAKDIIDSAFKDPVRRKEIRANPLAYQGRPRLKSALEIYQASMDLAERLDEVTLPFLVLHGEADVVTDPEVSQELYEKSKSYDKTIKKYPEMWHGLTTGEPDDNIELVFGDIIQWLDQRSPVRSVTGHGSPIRQSDLSLRGLQDSAKTGFGEACQSSFFYM